jgi:glycosyltransferase involved in cell wall biosynthesis
MKARVLFLSNIKEESKGGLFLSVANRTKNILCNQDIEGDVTSYIEKETIIVKLIKNLLKKKICTTKAKNFTFYNVTFNYIFNKINVLTWLISKISFQYKHKIMFKSIRKHVNIKNYNLIQVHWAYPMGYIAVMAKKRYGVPYILTVHGSDIHTQPYENKRIKKYTICALEEAEKVVFVSEKLLVEAKQLGYSAKNASIIPNGIDVNIFKIMDKSKIKKSESLNGNVVGFVGNLVKVKRADKLPEIFESISKFNNQIQFLVIGDGVLRKVIEDSCAEKNIKVKFTGRIEPEKVAYYMNAMDVMILPSRNEGWGSVVLEANACGVPVVGSDAGGIPEAIGEYGICVSEGVNFENRFAIKVIETLNHRVNESELRRRAIKYNWSTIALKEYELYGRILNVQNQ